MTEFLNLIKLNIWLIQALGASLILGLLSNYSLYCFVRKYYHPIIITPLSVIISAFKRAFYFIFPLIYFSLLVSLFNLPKTFYFLEILIKILITLALSLSAIKLLDYIDIWLERKKNGDINPTNLGVFITRAYLLKKVFTLVIMFLTFALILLNFPVVKEIGQGLLISAGVIGGILAFAAQKIFSSVFSGLNFILNKPIKVGDLIRISSELGTIEKITLNQIHLRSWDLRLIVYPLTYFMENSFQNLSHAENGLRGVVYFYTDYNVDIEQLRQVLVKILSDSPLWDKNSNTLEMTEANEKTIQLRAVVSAKNAGDLWKLRCHVRQQMIKFIQMNSPEIFSKERLQLERRYVSNKKNSQRGLPI